MPSKKKSNGNGRATIRDVLTAVTGLGARIDGTQQRIDGVADQMTELHTCMTELRETTNERLHDMEADITALRRPWLLLASGWTKAVAVGGFAAAISGTIMRLELWRFLPF